MLDKGVRVQDVLIRVQAKTFPGETVCICGSAPEIGQWQVGNALPLTQENAENEIWSGLIRITGNSVVEFRYLVAIILEPCEDHPQRNIVVRRWEINLHPRVLGVDSCNSIDIFGCYGLGSQEMIGPGWLMKESVVHLKFYNNPVAIWKNRFKIKPYSIHVTPIDLSRKDSDSNLFLEENEQDSSLYDLKPAAWPVVEVAAMNEHEWAYTQQSQFGRIYQMDDFMIFRAQMLDPNSIAYMVDFYSVGLETTPEHIGFCYVLPSNLRETSGTCTMPITGKRQQPIGQLTVEYLLVRPLPDFTCDCRISYAQHWKAVTVKKGLDVGHRGAGNARRTDKVENVLENTVASFNYAARHGADMVELDVQLSKDKIPVIYHDYYICISMKKRKQIDHEPLQISVKDLTAQQLQKLKLSPAGLTEKHKYDFWEDDHDDNQPFPTLQHVLQAVEPRIGFNVEIKCPMQYRDGTWEMTPGFELNSYIDIILQTLMEHAGSRFIILSCFHPDICSMVRLKQNKYPLLFLTQGQTDKYPPYLDTRTSSIPMAVYFALNTSLLGINVHTEELLRDRSLIQFVKAHKLTLFCWGEDNNASETIKSLKQDGVDGVIYDKVDEFRTANQDTAIFLVDTTSRVALLEAAGQAADASMNWSSSVSADSESP